MPPAGPQRSADSYAHVSHLIANVYGSIPCQQQRHDVHVALLRRQVERSDALPCHRVGGGAVLQQRGGYLHLILLGCDVEWRVAVLDENGRRAGEVTRSVRANTQNTR